MYVLAIPAAEGCIFCPVIPGPQSTDYVTITEIHASSLSLG